MATIKGFMKDYTGSNTLLPITRGELVLDKDGKVALTSQYFLAGGDNEYGLVTKAEREMLSGGTAGTGIADIYNKLNYINTGLKFSNQVLNFYTTEATPINIVSEGDGKINISPNANNVVNFSLDPLTSTETTASQILKSITVDKYGRVTAVSGSALTNAELPNTITSKTITDSTLTGCVTSYGADIGNNEKAIANKAYVDAKIQTVTGIATGALKFGGSLASATEASNALNDSNAVNSYYKVTTSFTLTSTSVHDITGSVLIDVGDTLIIHDNGSSVKFVHIPSGDDITALTFRKTGTDIATSLIGEIAMNFSEIFTVENPQGTQTINITIPEATSSRDGYISKEAFDKFSKYESNLKVIYTPTVTSATGNYTIGTITIGGTDQTIYGINNIYAFTLNNGATDAYNPILKFTETGASAVNITLKGTNGITVRKNGNNVEYGAANVVKSDSANYLTIDNGYQFGVKIGSGSGTSIVDGLTDYRAFSEVKTAVSSMLSIGTQFVEIENTLTATSGYDYYYGSSKLITAVTLDI